MVLQKFTMWVLKELITRAEDEWYSPEVIRQELESLRSRLESKELTIDEFSKQEELLVERLMVGRNRGIEE
ncbi:gas vesicle protein GvpG [Desulfosporosinus sp. SYSU MS00001]|uniref:gas vesicle protein GvpG n=1 Tax=Desulfosporosinus sp. SYSU MS00001 TaxID=3416284 RepID=UPI003CE834B0